MTLDEICERLGRGRLRAALVIGTVLLALPAAAQDYPSRPITIICGYGAGTGGDVISRYFADKMRAYTGGQPVVVDNKVGAQTAIAAAAPSALRRSSLVPAGTPVIAATAEPAVVCAITASGRIAAAARPAVFRQYPVKNEFMGTWIFQLWFCLWLWSI